jgi:hypothetical protein
MTVTPYLMLEVLANERRKDLKATAGARRRHARPTVEARSTHLAEASTRRGLIARFRHATAA